MLRRRKAASNVNMKLQGLQTEEPKMDPDVRIDHVKAIPEYKNLIQSLNQFGDPPFSFGGGGKLLRPCFGALSLLGL